MSSWLRQSRSGPKKSSWPSVVFPRLRRHYPRVAALGLLLAYAAVAITAYYSTLSPGALLLNIDLCDGAPCVSWVMPAGKAWDQGARPGMTVLSADGQDLIGGSAGDIPGEAIDEAELLNQFGEVLRLKVTQNAIGQSPIKFSVWILGGMFAVLGALVIVRRPDLYAARVFVFFSGATSLALAVAPSSGGPSPQWALEVQTITLTGVGQLFPPLALALAGIGPGARKFSKVRLFMGLGFLVLLAYAATVVVNPSLYELVRPIYFLYVAMSVIGAVTILSVKGLRQKSPTHRQEARIALWGIGLSTLPFVMLSLVPDAIFQMMFLPNHFTVLAWGLMPVAFAYAILQHQLLGIRRLVHRGIVYGITSFLLMMLIASALIVATSYVNITPPGDTSIPLLATIVVAGLILFFPLRSAARWFVDRYFYKDNLNYHGLIVAVGADISISGQVSQVTSGMAQSLLEELQLESVLLYLGESPSDTRLVATAGKRSGEVAEQLIPNIQEQMGQIRSGELAETRWQSDTLLMTTLTSPQRFLGYLILGPKKGGEIFVDEEKRLIASVIPVLALAIDKVRLSEDLREINKRLIRTDEEERARISRDVHDGPLQKAMMLARMGTDSNENLNEVALQLASELREVCSRLRPAILDDLGVVSAMEWLLDGISKQSGLSTKLSLGDIDEYERFYPEGELALFRITQEAANNVMKHAVATTLDVFLRKDDGRLILEVTDDGVGFSPSSGRGEGLGLSGMFERVAHLNGSFDIETAPGSGTTIVARIPINDVNITRD